jgi:hypothetical protein
MTDRPKQHGPDDVRLGHVQIVEQRMLELSNRGPEDVLTEYIRRMLGDYLRAGGNVKDFRMDFSDTMDPWSSQSAYPIEGVEIRLLGWKA